MQEHINAKHLRVDTAEMGKIIRELKAVSGFQKKVIENDSLTFEQKDFIIQKYSKSYAALLDKYEVVVKIMTRNQAFARVFGICTIILTAIIVFVK